MVKLLKLKFKMLKDCDYIDKNLWVEYSNKIHKISNQATARYEIWVILPIFEYNDIDT